jgi:hypothetical protein
MPVVLVSEWRRRAAEQRAQSPAAADAYEKCAKELEELDVHTEGAPAGTETLQTRVDPRMVRLAVGLAAGAMVVAALASARVPSNR